MLGLLSGRLQALRDCAGRACRKLPALREAFRYDDEENRCVDRKLEVAINGRDANVIDRVRIGIGRRVIDRETLFPFIASLERSELGAGNSVKLTTVVEMIDGRRTIRSETIKLCG